MYSYLLKRTAILILVQVVVLPEEQQVAQVRQQVLARREAVGLTASRKVLQISLHLTATPRVDQEEQCRVETAYVFLCAVTVIRITLMTGFTVK